MKNKIKYLIYDFRVESIHNIQGKHFPSTYTSLIQYQYQPPDLQFIDHFQACQLHFTVAKQKVTEQSLRKVA